MDKKNLALVAGIIIVVILIVIFQQQGSVKNPVTPVTGTPSAVLTVKPVTSIPASTFTIKALLFPTVIIPNAEQEGTEVTRTAEAYVITLKEKNWAKQYEKLYHSDLVNQVKEAEYVDFWQSNLGSHPINLATIEKVDFIPEYKIAKLNKTFTNVAVVQARFLQADNKVYTNPILDFIYFAKDESGYWRFIGYPQ